MPLHCRYLAGWVVRKEISSCNCYCTKNHGTKSNKVKKRLDKEQNIKTILKVEGITLLVEWGGVGWGGVDVVGNSKNFCFWFILDFFMKLQILVTDVIYI